MYNPQPNTSLLKRLWKNEHTEGREGAGRRSGAEAKGEQAAFIFLGADKTSATGRLFGSSLGLLLMWCGMYLTVPAVLVAVKCV